jgi:hypothetical protein
MAEDFAHIHASVPKIIEGEVMLEINRLAGMITSIERQPDSRTGISATLPKKHLTDFKSWLENYSGSRGSVSED